MRAKIALLVSVSLLPGVIAAQPVPCASVAPEVRDRVREAGACRDAAPDDAAASQATVAPSGTVTVRLSDGTVVRVPREIGANINDARKGVPTDGLAAKGPTRARAAAPFGSKASGDSAVVPQKLQVPDVIGRSYVDAGSALAEFNVDRTQTASSAPAGEVLAQEPAAASLVLPGSTVRLQVSDGSLAGAVGAGTVPTATDAPTSVPALAADPAPPPVPQPASVAPATRIVEPDIRGGFSIVLSANWALFLAAGVLLGLIFGALVTRQWQLRRELMTDRNAAPAPTLYQNQPVDTASVAAAAAVVPEARFTARRDPGETTIEFVPFGDDDAFAIEHASEQHG